ncbi:MAG: response regulator transcription factor [Myxococcota bacterium]
MSAPKPTAGARKRIIVAEDDTAIATLLTRVLSQHYDVSHAASGSRALEMAAEPPAPALFMLDVMMPDLDGFAVATKLRTIQQLKHVPIIFLTARTAPTDIIRGIQTGARHYIQKPFKIEDVLNKVKKTIGE